MERVPNDVGICRLNSGREVGLLVKEFYRQGAVFKSRDAYKNRPTEPCYVPELSDSVYTAEDFLHICNGQKEFADELFDKVDWQHPETLLEDWLRNNEWVECPDCGRLLNYGDGCNDGNCPDCGVKAGDEQTGKKGNGFL